MNIYNGLTGQGFKNIEDFSLRDDGEGVYIEKWFSPAPQPTDEEISNGEQTFSAQQEARETLRQSMITKLAATLTPEETALLEELL